MAKAVKTPKTNAMRELESAGISYVLHTYEDDGDGDWLRSRRLQSGRYEKTLPDAH